MHCTTGDDHDPDDVPVPDVSMLAWDVLPSEAEARNQRVTRPLRRLANARVEPVEQPPAPASVAAPLRLAPTPSIAARSEQQSPGRDHRAAAPSYSPRCSCQTHPRANLRRAPVREDYDEVDYSPRSRVVERWTERTTEGATGASRTIAGAPFVSGALGASVTRGVGAGAAGTFSTAARVTVFGAGGCLWALEWSRCDASMALTTGGVILSVVITRTLRRAASF